MAITRDQAIKNATNRALEKFGNKHLSVCNATCDAEQIANMMMEEIQEEFDEHNRICDKNEKWPMLLSLSPYLIGRAILHFYHVRYIVWGNAKQNGILAVYCDEGADKGLYVEDEYLISRIARQFNSSVTKKECDEIMYFLKTEAEEVRPTKNKDLIAVNNGIFDYRTKKLISFSPDYVFTAKCRVDYISGSQNPIIHNDEDGTDWDVDGWLDEVASGDAEVVKLLWEIMGAIIRPLVRWDKMVWFFSRKGMNGKGTFCELCKQLCGEGSYASIPVVAFEQQFLLEELVHCTAVITDENPTTEFSKNPSTLKAMVTGDTVQINRKNKQPITFTFSGLIVQCVNELPKFGDTTDSLYRRILTVPFNKTFIGCERKYIKQDYMHRTDVLEYVLCKVLNMNHYTLSEPAVCKEALEEYKVINDVVSDFFAEMFPQFRWILLPWDFLFDLFRSWYGRNVPSGHLMNKRQFTQRLRQIIDNGYADKCEYSEGDRSYRVNQTNMSGYEPLVDKYNLESWHKNNEGRAYVQRYKGVVRKNVPMAMPCGQPWYPSNSCDYTDDSYSSGELTC